MRKLILAFALLIALAPTVLAQAPVNAVVQHYLAYNAARQRGDLATADAEAAAALAASEVRDGDGGRTIVLAVNLATTRLLRNDAAGALAPAQRAFALAQAGAAGVTSEYAALVLGQAELLRFNQPDRLRILLESPQLSQLPDDEIYPAASQLGAWGIEQRDYPLAEFAWSIAATHAEGADLGRPYGFGHARTWQAAAIFFDEIGAGRANRIGRGRAIQADALLREALQTLYPFARPTDDGQISIGLHAYGQALVLRSALVAKTRSDGRNVPGDDVDGFVLDGSTNSAPRCSARLVRPLISFPDDALERGNVGGVALLLQFDESGAQERATELARLGDASFAEVLLRAAPRWRLERDSGAQPNCRMPRYAVIPVQFVNRSQ